MPTARFFGSSSSFRVLGLLRPPRLSAARQLAIVFKLGQVPLNQSRRDPEISGDSGYVLAQDETPGDHLAAVLDSAPVVLCPLCPAPTLNLGIGVERRVASVTHFTGPARPIGQRAGNWPVLACLPKIRRAESRFQAIALAGVV